MSRQSFYRDGYFWAAVLLGGFLLSLTLWFRFTMDQAICNYVAWVWKDKGLPPYVGAWDLSWPGIFILHRLVLETLGESTFAFRFFDFLVQTGSLAMIFYLARKLARSSVAGFLAAVLYAIYYFRLGPLETGEREGFVLCLLLLATVIGLELKGRIFLRAALVGLLAGMAFQLKPTYGLSWLVFGAWFLAEGLKSRPKPAAAELALFALACILPTLLIAAYYWRIGHLADLYYATIYFNFKVYGGTTLSVFRGGGWTLALAVANSVFTDQPLTWFFAAAAMLIPFQAPDPGRKKLFGILLALTAVSFISHIIQAKFFPYQLTPGVGFATVIAGMGIVRTAERLGQSLGLASAARAKLFYAALLLFALAGLSPQAIDSAMKFAFRNPSRAYHAGQGYDAFYYRAAQALSPMIGSEEMQYFGWHPLLPYLLHKKLPARFCVVDHLLIRDKNGRITPLQRKWIEEYTDSVIARRPKFFLVSDQVPGWTIFNLQSPSLKEALRREFPRLQKFLEENYALKTTVGEIEVYELVKSGR